MFLRTLIFATAAFVGYLIGRWGHYYLNGKLKNPKWTPHHWIYGLILMVLGLVFYKNFLMLSIFSFGVGHFVSDLKDFLKLKFIGPDEEGKKNFWGID